MSTFDVQHQPRALRTIQRSLASRRMPHAYLFSGPEGVGKELMAMGLARTLLCAKPIRRSLAELEAQARIPARSASEGVGGRASCTPGGQDARPSEEGDAEVPGGRDAHPLEGLDACGKCPECQLSLAGTHPDLAIIYRQLNRQHSDSRIRKQKALFLSVDVIREFLVERAGTFPSRGRARIFVVREAERMNPQAQNALLKTLEEPPPSTFLILLTTSLDQMLPTTRSRCQQVLFQPLPVEFVAKRLRELRPQSSPQEVQYVARHVGGSLGGALRQVDDGLFVIKQQWGGRLAEMAAAGGGSVGSGFAPHALAKPLDADARQLGKSVSDRDPDVSETDAVRAGLQQLLSVLADFYTDAIRRASGSNLPLTNADQADVVEVLALNMKLPGLVAALGRIREADSSLARNAAIELTLETLFIQLARAGRSEILA